jgi:hypothetical protein
MQQRVWRTLVGYKLIDNRSANGAGAEEHTEVSTRLRALDLRGCAAFNQPTDAARGVCRTSTPADVYM